MNVVSALIRFIPSVYFGVLAKDHIFKSSKIKKQLDESNKAFLLKKFFPDILDNEEIRSDIYVKFNDHCIPAACGTTFGPSPVIQVNNRLTTISVLTSKFLCRQGIYQIKTNCGIIVCSLALLASTITAFALPYLGLTSWLYVVSHLLPFYVAVKVSKLINTFYSNKTLLLAVNKAKNDELVCMKNYFVTQLNEVKKLKQFYVCKTIAKRLSQIETEIQKRKIIEREVDIDNIKELEEFHKQFFVNNLTVLKMINLYSFL